MAKKCDCHGVIAMMETDPRLRSLPLAPRMLWFALVRAMQSMGLAAYRLGSEVPNALTIALAIGITETELEANLPTLLARGLLEHAEDGALVSPFLRAALVRSETNRNNGLKGGRPRKLTPATDPRQGHMAHSIPGGAAVAAVVSDPIAKPNPAASGSPAKLADPSAKTVKLAVPDDAFHATGRAVLDAMGIDQARSMTHYGIVRQWMADGADQALILDVIAAKLARGARPSQPAYFTKAIADAVQKRDAEAAPAGQPETQGFAEWQRARGEWIANGRVGPMPKPPTAAGQVAA